MAKYLLNSICNKYVSATVLTAWSTVVPVFTAVLAFMFLKTPFQVSNIFHLTCSPPTIFSLHNETEIVVEESHSYRFVTDTFDCRPRQLSYLGSLPVLLGISLVMEARGEEEQNSYKPLINFQEDPY